MCGVFFIGGETGYCAERAPLHRGLRPADHCLSEPRPARQAGKPGTVNLANSFDNCFVLNHLFRQTNKCVNIFTL